eukprot:TRINITY_DN9744_c0_g1_i1.p1 TRINITY_DN9744_c0_g1~~TRINITY_DN9744_c0_g1_i1.p1  ORF type:complete len:257 (+),score=84.13 TRINITY_DN9744_c0_g1_i1:41-772(+)
MPSRRAKGLKGLQQQQIQKQKIQELGQTMEEETMSQMRIQLGNFKEKLEEFALNHRDEINNSPIFRNEFQKMCRELGVDPLASNKGFWASILGVGDFYYDLGVKILTIAIRNRNFNGGMMKCDEILLNLQKASKNVNVSIDDLTKAVEKVNVLNPFLKIINISNTLYLQSVPLELSNDDTEIISLAQKYGGYVTKTNMGSLHWSVERIERVLESFIARAMVWIDSQNVEETTYWFPSLLDFTL